MDIPLRVGFALARKKFSDDDVIRLLRQIAPKGVIKSRRHLGQVLRMLAD